MNRLLFAFIASFLTAAAFAASPTPVAPKVPTDGELAPAPPITNQPVKNIPEQASAAAQQKAAELKAKAPSAMPKPGVPKPDLKKPAAAAKREWKPAPALKR